MLKFILAVILTIIAVNAGLLTAVQAMWTWGVLTAIGFVLWVIIIVTALWANKKNL